jgi:hypothetical protein
VGRDGEERVGRGRGCGNPCKLHDLGASCTLDHMPYWIVEMLEAC